MEHTQKYEEVINKYAINMFNDLCKHISSRINYSIFYDIEDSSIKFKKTKNVLYANENKQQVLSYLMGFMSSLNYIKK